MLSTKIKALTFIENLLTKESDFLIKVGGKEVESSIFSAIKNGY